MTGQAARESAIAAPAAAIMAPPAPQLPRLDRLEHAFLRRQDARSVQYTAPRARPHRVVEALVSDGDSRLALDPSTGLNKYLCPPAPAPGLLCAASCTASPIAEAGFARAEAVFDRIAGAPSDRIRTRRLAEEGGLIAAAILQRFAAEGLAEVLLCPSGTDALLTATTRLAAERPDAAITTILPCAAETGTGVPLAAACRHFDGALHGRPAGPGEAATVEVPLRDGFGAPLPSAEVDAGFAQAADAARRAGRRPITMLTHGTKTGLVAPLAPPDEADVIVDACQARIEPALVAAFLRRGWPVVITGSKFFGGPAFSGALLFPHGRRSAPNARSIGQRALGLGTVLRWTAACAAMSAFAPHEYRMASVLDRACTAIAAALAANPILTSIDGARPKPAAVPAHWSHHPSIFTFAVTNPADQRRRLSVSELRRVYGALATAGILLGQPVDLGPFGGLRIALGARDAEPDAAEGLTRILAGISALTVTG
jgi:hypothetical protein